MSPFAPFGDRPRWVQVYEELVKHDVGEIVTYKVLGRALGLHPDDDRHPIQMAVRRAAREFEKTNLRALEALPNQGYRIVQPAEHIRLARAQQAKSSRALARGHSTVTHVDLTGMEPETRKAFEVVAQAFAYQMDFNRRLDIRTASLEQAVLAITETRERTDEEVAELRARLERLEGKATDAGG
jgi:hypothetical protein